MNTNTPIKTNNDFFMFDWFVNGQAKLADFD
jgi:hypothetical protein